MIESVLGPLFRDYSEDDKKSKESGGGIVVDGDEDANGSREEGNG